MGSRSVVDVHVEQRALDFARFISCAVEAGGAVSGAAEVFARRFPRAASLSLVEKAAVDVGSSTDTDWANPLVAVRPLPQAFLQLLSARTLVGQLDLLRVPFHVSVPSQTGAGVYAWSGEQASKAVTSLAFQSTANLTPTKASGIVVVTRDLLQLAQPGTERALLTALSRGVSRFLDQQFSDPTVAAVAGVHPASITNGVTPITSTGPVADLKALVHALQTAHPYAESLVLMLSPSNATALRLALTAPLDLPIVTSSVLGTTVILADPSAIAVAEGELWLDLSRQAVLQMETAPLTPPIQTGTTAVSLWQQNLVGLRAERMINWQVLISGAVQYTTADYSTP
jgi:Phage capsid family